MCKHAKKPCGCRLLLLLLDADARDDRVPADVDLADLLARGCSCDVIRSRDMTSSDRAGDATAVVLVHSPFARYLYDTRGVPSSSTVDDVFKAVVSDLISQSQSSEALTRVYHVCFLADTCRDVNSLIIPYATTVFNPLTPTVVILVQL